MERLAKAVYALLEIRQLSSRSFHPPRSNVVVKRVTTLARISAARYGWRRE